MFDTDSLNDSPTRPQLRPVPDRRSMPDPLLDLPLRITHIRDASAYWTITGWGSKAQATVYAPEDRARVALPSEGCWEVVAGTPDLAPEQIAGAAYVWARMKVELQAQPELAAIVRILNTVDQWRNDVPSVKDFFDRELKDARRLCALAKQTLNALDPEILQDAVDAVAMRISEEVERPYVCWRDLDDRSQSYYRRLAQSCLNERDAVLERLDA